MNALYFTSFIFCTMLVTYLSIRLNKHDRLKIWQQQYEQQQEIEKQQRHNYADELIAKIPEHENTL
ncbi:MAG: hypothetical protein ABI091_26875 [Ferruginibacter sp.]